jgi:diguanylate cyclase (GGDEF)-like protein
VVDEDRLSAVLSEFARTLATEFPIQQILDHLVERIVGILPITSAGVTLIDEEREPRFVAASDGDALRYERLQTAVGQGPCVVAYDSGEPVAVPDLASDERFPAFTTAALDAGLAAVFTFPLHHGEGRLGALDLYRETPGGLDPHTMATAQTLADVAAAYLINAQARDDARAASDQHRQRALHDALTGLPNRLLLQDRFEHAAQRAARTHESVAVLFVDLDDFKRINDTHGHHVGDELLHAVARRLAALVRPDDTLARVSGDEFVFLCENLADRLDADLLVRRIAASFRVPFELSGLEVTLTASVGIAVAGPGEVISDRLLVEADAAMYRVKRQGRVGMHPPHPGEALDLRNSDLDPRMRAALANDEFEVVYQPQVRSTDGLIVGVEALLRWTDATWGAVPPSVIVAIAERSELIREIGAWVLRRSCDDHQRWCTSHRRVALDLAVNVSVRQLLAPGFVATVARALAATDTPASAVVLEITESVLMDDAGRAQLVLNEVRETGIRIALDDFGTGFSSLSYLRQLPIDIIKIDRSFVADVDVPMGGGAILAAVTNLAHVLRLPVTAEGVETQQQHDTVSAIGCELAQGFFYARPMTATAIDELLGANGGSAGHLPIDQRTSSIGSGAPPAGRDA